MVLAVWLFADVLNANEGNLLRIRRLSWGAAGFMWLAFIIGGYWYVNSYKVDKAIILKGSWPFAHNMVMETKEHLVIMLLLLVTYLPIVAANNLATNMSGGQQQRVAIARALAMNPALILADEPTGNLDTKSADQVFQMMREVNRANGTTFLLVTHSPELAKRCDRIVEVVDGRITPAGP